MIKRNDITKYFDTNAETWLDDNYKKQSYTYPVPPNRNRITFKIIKENFQERLVNLLDIGCGGGNFCLESFKKGYKVTGVDQSKKMISIAQQKILDANADVLLINHNIMDVNLEDDQFDVITALGLVEYLEDENKLWENVQKWLKPGGLFIADFRNRLFNMVSISDYTKKEIKNNGALELIDEIQELFSITENEDIEEFFSRLSKISNYLNIFWKDRRLSFLDIKNLDYIGSVEGTQHTPKQTANTAKKFEMANISNYGVHPHLLLPKINKLLPPQAFNLLSDSLLPFEDSPISLIWSSKFIGVFKENSKVSANTKKK